MTLFSCLRLERRSRVRDSWSNTSSLIPEDLPPQNSTGVQVILEDLLGIRLLIVLEQRHEYPYCYAGDTPRRSARLSEKTKAVVAPTSQSPKKKQKRSGTKGAREKTNADPDEEATTGEKDAPAEEAKETLETSTVDAKDAADVDVVPEKPNCEDVEKKADAEEPAAAAPVDTEEPNYATTAVVPDAQQVEESKETPSVVPDPKADKSKEAPDAENDEGKEATSAGKETPDGKAETAAAATEERGEEKEEPFLQEPPKTGS